MGASGGGDRDVTFRFLADVGDAVEGVKSVGTEVKTLGTEIKETAKAPDELALAMERAEKAVAKLSDPKLSPIALQRAVLQADLATEGLAEAMKKAAATGGPTPPELTAKVKAFEAAVVSANARAGALRDRLADLRVKGDQTAQGFEKMTQYGGSATSMMQGLADSSTGLVGGFGKAALATFGVVEALKLGWEAGNKVRLLYSEMTGKELPNLTDRLIDLTTGIKNASGEFDKSGTPITAFRERVSKAQLAVLLLNQELDKKSAALAKLSPAVAAATLGTQGYATAFDALSKRVGDYVLASVGVGQVSFDMRETMLGMVKTLGAVSEADVEVIRATNNFKEAQKTAIFIQHDYDEALKKNSSNTNSLGEYTKETKDKIDALELKLMAANRQLEGTRKALADAAAAAKEAAPAFDPLAGAFYTAEEAASAADTTIGTMEFTMGKTGKEATSLGGGFKGAATAMDTAKQAGVELSNASGTLTTSIAGMADEQGPVKKLGGGFKGLQEAANPAATAVGEISNKTGELIGKVTPLSAEDGPVHKLAGGFGVVTDAGQKVIEKNGEMITSLASINRAMLESIEVAYKLQAALAAAASGGTNK